MWSDSFWYYNIRSDKNYSQALPVVKLTEILKNTGVLLNVGPQAFKNTVTFPWIDVMCVTAESDGNFYQEKSAATETSNLIAIVASRLSPGNKPQYLKLLNGIANQLGWELVLEADDDGNKNIILNRPNAD